MKIEEDQDDMSRWGLEIQNADEDKDTDRGEDENEAEDEAEDED